MALFNPIVAHITLKDNYGVEQNVIIPNLKRPVGYQVLADHLSKMGEEIVVLTNTPLTLALRSSIRLSHILQVHLQNYIQAQGHRWTVLLR